MPASPSRPLIESAWPTSDPQRDHDQLGRVVWMLAWLTAVIAVVSVVTALVMGSVQLLIMSVVLGVFVGWIRWSWPQVPERGGAWFVMQVALAVLIIVLLFLVLLPETGFGMTGLALIPVVVGLPYLESRRMRRLIVLAWVMCVGIAICAELATWSTRRNRAARATRLS